MRRKSDDPDVAQKQWSDQHVDHNESDVRAALNHADGRNERVAQILCYLSLMRAAGTISATSGLVRVTRAEFQNYHGPAGTQAAHFLPGQLKIGPRLVSQHIADENTRRKLDGLFGDVETLRPDFNKADSQAEKDGLCDAFAAACYAVIRTGSPAGAGQIDRRNVKETYKNIWVPGARTAFQTAMAKKGAKYTPPPLRFGQLGTPDYGNIMNLHEREAATAYQRNR